ncbi:MAG: uracil-DNA glycosylase [Betaproteobacteria bacterium]
MAMSRRELILREMGLTPVWKARHAAGGLDEPAEAPPVAAPTRAFVEDQEAGAQTPSVAREARIAKMDWVELKAAVPECTACALHASRTQSVFGVGDEDADWLLVGEAPGAEEDQAGEPFVGQAGRLLDAMLAAIGLSRDRNVYIANVLKCRPPGNRNPEPGEVARCAPHLARQIELVRPRLVLAMGRFAVQALLNTSASIASLRGKVHSSHGVPLIATYHPAYLLRTPEDKAKAWQDLLFAVHTMQGLQPAAAVPI